MTVSDSLTCKYNLTSTEKSGYFSVIPRLVRHYNNYYYTIIAYLFRPSINADMSKVLLIS